VGQLWQQGTWWWPNVAEIRRKIVEEEKLISKVVLKTEQNICEVCNRMLRCNIYVITLTLWVLLYLHMEVVLVPQPRRLEAVTLDCSHRTGAVPFCDIRASSALSSVGVYFPSQISRYYGLAWMVLSKRIVGKTWDRDTIKDLRCAGQIIHYVC
jgi:hypothetical protein